MSKQKHTLQSIPYGTVVEYRRRRYYKCQGQEGDILMAENDGGMWYWIAGGCPASWEASAKDWKQFKVLYMPT